MHSTASRRHRSESRLRSVGKNEYAFGLIAKLATVSFGLVQTVAMARFLGPELRGDLAFDLSIIGVANIVLSFGLFDAYAYFKRHRAQDALERASYLDIFMSTLAVLYGAMAVVAIITTGVVVLVAGEFTRPALYLLAVPLWSFSLISGYVMLIESLNRRNLALFCLSGIEMSIALVLLLFAPRYYLLGIGASVAIEIAKAIYFTSAIHFRFSLGLVTLRHIGELARFGFVPMLSVLLTTINYRIDVILLGSSPSVSAASVGVYAIGMALAEKSMTIGDSMREVLASRLAGGRGEQEVARAMRISFTVTLVMTLAIVALGQPFISILYGSAYDNAYAVTAIILLGTAWMVFFKMIAQYNVMRRRQGTNLALLSVGVVVNILLNLLLIPVWGIVGSAAATAIAYFLCSALFLMNFRRVTGIPVMHAVLVRRQDLAALRRN